MDPIPDLPPPAELAAHTAHAANPTPGLTPNHNHPPYAEMITAAIAALKDKEGSSRQAIGKYIEKTYANLPPSHQALLTNHLKRLKNSGQLVMIKHSYALPGSVPFPPPPGNTVDSTTAVLNASYTGSKRKPGRPPKVRPDAEYQQAVPVPEVQHQPPLPPYSSMGSGAGFGHEVPLPAYSVGGSGFGQEIPGFSMGGGPGFGLGSEGQGYHPTGQDVQLQAYPVGGPEPMFVSLGLDDGPVPATAVPAPTAATEAAPAPKRGRGRPPRSAANANGNGNVNGNVNVAATAAGSGGPTVLGKRARGRPPRSITDIMMSNGGGGLKRGRGRPKVTAPVIVPLGGGSPGPKGVQPKKIGSAGLKSSGRPRGRPPKNGASHMVPLSAVGAGIVPAGRPGRPVKNGVAKRPRKLSGKPVGRPRKNSAVTAVLVTDPQQLVAYQELKNKLEHIQLKVKQTAYVLRPCLGHEGATNALGALQELEALATGESSAPVNVQSQEPPVLIPHDQETLF